MKNLKVFDLKNNPLDCNDDFRNLMKFLGTRKASFFCKFCINLLLIIKIKQISLGNNKNHGELEEMKATFFEEMSPAIEWNELARKICRRNEENKLNDKQVLDDIDETEDDYDEDADNDDDGDDDSDIQEEDSIKEKVSTKKPIVPSKAPKEKPTAKPKATSSVAPSVVDSNNENDESAADDDYDYNEEDEDDEDEDREDESITEKPDKNILLDGIQVIKKVENRIFGKKKIISTSNCDLLIF